MAGTSRTGRIVAEDRGGAIGLSGLTSDAAIDSYRLSLRAATKSPATINLAALARFRRFLAERGMRVLRAIRREHVEAFIVSFAGRGAGAGRGVGRLAVVLQDVVDKREPRGTV